MPPQIADTISLEAVTTRGPSTLAIENAGDHRVGVEGRKASDKFDCVLVGPNGRRSRPRQRHVEIDQRPAFPAQRDMRSRLVAVDCEDDLFDERPQEFLAVTGCRGRRLPDGRKVSSKGEQALAVLLPQDTGALPFASGEFALRVSTEMGVGTGHVTRS